MPNRIGTVAALMRPETGKIRFWCNDESRFGLMTETGKRITLTGVKPIKNIQFEFKSYWIYGTVEPLTGENFFIEFENANGDCFQSYINAFSEAYPNDVHIIQLDNAGFHTAKKIKIPENIVLFFQPPHCPELNPIERVWQYIKKILRFEIFDNIESLKNTVADILRETHNSVWQKIIGWEYILSALAYANI